jgi:sugar-specific transcriptional regulator TrmB
MADLRDLGLSEYEASAYRALLETGPATAKELSEASGVPMGRIYDVLGSIEAQHLVRSQAASRPKKYAAVEPDTALDRLLEDRKRELDEKADQYEAVVDELAHDLEHPTEPADGFWTAELGPENSIELLLERIDAAEEHILIISGTLSSSFDLGDVGGQVIEHLVQALDRGVTVWMLIDAALERELPPDVTRRYADAILEYDRFDVRVNQAVDGNITIIDRAEVCLELSNPVSPEESFAMIDLQDTSFASEVRRSFEDTWENAERI